jgi:hypothetical protein
MKLGSGIRRLLRQPAGVRAIEREVDDELRFHVETRIDVLMSQGMTRQAAEAQARQEFGDLGAAHDEIAAIDRARVQRERRTDWWEALLQDARFATRALLGRPSFLVIASVTLGRGIGANAAIFSVVDATLPAASVRRAHRLDQSVLDEIASPGVYVEVRNANRTLDPLAGYSGGASVSMTGASEPARLVMSEVTSRFFDLLGTRAELGRTFLDGEDQPGRDRLVVLGHGLWQQRFGGDRGVIGRSVVVDGIPRTIVGVMPADFRFPSPAIDLWAPVSLDASPANIGRYWGTSQLNVIGRLRSGVSVARAQQELAMLVDRSRASFPWRMPDDHRRGRDRSPARAESRGRHWPDAPAAVRVRRRSPAHRLCQRREPAAGSGGRARARDRDSCVARRGTRQDR